MRFVIPTLLLYLTILCLYPGSIELLDGRSAQELRNKLLNGAFQYNFASK